MRGILDSNENIKSTKWFKLAVFSFCSCLVLTISSIIFFFRRTESEFVYNTLSNPLIVSTFDLTVVAFGLLGLFSSMRSMTKRETSARKIILALLGNFTFIAFFFYSFSIKIKELM